MVIDPSPRCVGLEFVRQYYTVLNRAPACLHRFYSNDSKFLHSGEVVIGQTDIHKKILSLGFNDCHAKIQLVDAFSTLGDGVLIQVTGELSNNGMPMRRFTQSIVLAPQSPKKYYVHSDIFHYIDEMFNEEPPIDASEQEDELDNIASSEENFVGHGKTVNGTMHDQPDVPPYAVSSMQGISQSAESESDYSVMPVAPVMQSPMAENPPPVSPIPHLKPESLNESIVTIRSPNSVKDDDWQTDSPPLTDSPTIKSEETPKKAVLVEQPKSAPEPVISNEPRTYANLCKSSLYQSMPTQSTTTTYQSEPAATTLTNHVAKQKPEVRSFTKPSTVESPGSFQKPSTRQFQEDDRRRPAVPDSHQVFVGNLPHTISEEELKDTFREFGKVVDVRINTAKGKTSNKGANHPVPNFGFISFETEEAADKCLEARPIYLNGESRINVEEKKARTNRPMDGGNSMPRMAGSRGVSRGMSRGGLRGGFGRGGEIRGGRGGFSQRR